MQINSHIYAFHVLFTKPSLSVGKSFSMIEAEVLVMIISALMWRKYNGKIKLFTDIEGLKFIEKNGITDIWDEIDVSVLENNKYPIDPNIFWASGKLIALEVSNCPCIMLDTDLIVMHPIFDILDASDITALHPESINPEVYINPIHLKTPKGYRFPDYYCWDVLPSNTALLFIKNNQFKEYYLNQAKMFMFNNFVKPMEFVSQMVFAEQRLLSICAKHVKKTVGYILHEPYSPDNKTIIHLWGYKNKLRSNKYLHAIFIEKLIDRFQPELGDFDLFNSFIEKKKFSLSKEY